MLTGPSLFGLALIDASVMQSVLLDVLVKGAVLTALIVPAALLLRRRVSAAVRHQLWLLALVGLLALPALSITLPGWQVVRLPAWTGDTDTSTAPPQQSDRTASQSDESASNQITQRKQRSPSPPAMVDPSMRPTVRPSPRNVDAPQTDGRPVVSRSERVRTQDVTSEVDPVNENEPAAASSSESTGSSTTTPAPSSTNESPPLPWATLIVCIYAAGMVLVLVPYVLGHLQLRRLLRHSERATDDAWHNLLAQARREMNIKRDVRLLLSPRAAVPMTLGIARPIIILPSEAHTWDRARRHVVLLHELAHVQRFDCFNQLLARFACALHWPNPFAWLAQRRLRVEAERASDDRVLAVGAKSSDYAEHLLQLAVGARALGLANHAALPMARRSTLEGRLLAILDPKRKRQALGRLGAALAVVALAAVLVPIACVQVAEENDGNEDVANEQAKQEQSDARPTVTLPGGSPLEFLAVTEPTVDGRKWWTPGGAVISDPNPFSGPGRRDAPEGKIRRTFYLRISGIEDVYAGEAPDLRIESGGAADVETNTGTRPQLEGYQDGVIELQFEANFPRDQKTTDLRVGIASGPWKTVAEDLTSRDNGEANHNGEVEFGGVLGGFNSLSVVFTYNWEPATREIDVAMFDPAGQSWMPATLHKPDPSNPRHIMAVFHANQQGDIDELFTNRRIRVRTRPYRHWVEFRNVSLEPGHETQVEAEIVADDDQPGRGLAELRRAMVLLSSLRSLHEPLLRRIEREDAEGALAVLQVFEQNSHEVLELVRGTEVEPSLALLLQQLQLTREAVQEGDFEFAESLLLNAGFPEARLANVVRRRERKNENEQAAVETGPVAAAERFLQAMRERDVDYMVNNMQEVEPVATDELREAMRRRVEGSHREYKPDEWRVGEHLVEGGLAIVETPLEPDGRADDLFMILERQSDGRWIVRSFDDWHSDWSLARRLDHFRKRLADESDSALSFDDLEPAMIGERIRVYTSNDAVTHTGTWIEGYINALDDGTVMYDGTLDQLHNDRLVLGSIPPAKRTTVQREDVRFVEVVGREPAAADHGFVGQWRAEDIAVESEGEEEGWIELVMAEDGSFTVAYGSPTLDTRRYAGQWERQRATTAKFGFTVKMGNRQEPREMQAQLLRRSDAPDELRLTIPASGTQFQLKRVSNEARGESSRQGDDTQATQPDAAAQSPTLAELRQAVALLDSLPNLREPIALAIEQQDVESALAVLQVIQQTSQQVFELVRGSEAEPGAAMLQQQLKLARDAIENENFELAASLLSNATDPQDTLERIIEQRERAGRTRWGPELEAILERKRAEAKGGRDGADADDTPDPFVTDGAAAQPADEWGEANNGVQARLRADKLTWAAGQTPTFHAEIRNTGEGEYTVAQTQQLCELELDGKRYTWTGAVRVRSSWLPPDRHYKNIPIALTGNWVKSRAIPGERSDRMVGFPASLQAMLSPGRHRLRVIFFCDGADSHENIVVKSNAIAFEVTAPGDEGDARNPADAPNARASTADLIAPLKADFAAAHAALMEQDDPEAAQRVLERMAPQLEQLEAAVKGTEAEGLVSLGIEELHKLQEALEEDRIDEAKTRMRALNQAGAEIERAIEQASTQPKTEAQPASRIPTALVGTWELRGEPTADFQAITFFGDGTLVLHEIIDDDGTERKRSGLLEVDDDVLDIELTDGKREQATFELRGEDVLILRDPAGEFDMTIFDRVPDEKWPATQPQTAARVPAALVGTWELRGEPAGDTHAIRFYGDGTLLLHEIDDDGTERKRSGLLEVDDGVLDVELTSGEREELSFELRGENVLILGDPAGEFATQVFDRVPNEKWPTTQPATDSRRGMDEKSERFVYLEGQTNRPGVYHVSEDEPLTLRQLLAAAGSLLVGKLEQEMLRIEVHRRDEDEAYRHVRTYRYDELFAEDAEAVVLRGGDRVKIVSARLHAATQPDGDAQSK